VASDKANLIALLDAHPL